MYIPCNLKFMKKRPEAVARSWWISQKIYFITFKSQKVKNRVFSPYLKTSLPNLITNHVTKICSSFLSNSFRNSYGCNSAWFCTNNSDFLAFFASIVQYILRYLSGFSRSCFTRNNTDLML